MLRSLVCKITGHKISRNRVWHDGLNFRTDCTRCDKNMLREQSGWREFKPENDTDMRRGGHPNGEQAMS